MRYLGNKTKLVPFILRTVKRLEIEPGVACDPFAGTASVSIALKRAGWTVRAGDLMATSFAFQIARVALDATPRFSAKLLPENERNGSRRISYRRLLAWLSSGEAAGFVTEHYTPAGTEGSANGRMYFTEANARKIDFVRERIQRWVDEELIDGGRAQLLLATLIEAADRVANTTGVYASFVKTWQPNAVRDLDLRPIVPTPRADDAGPSSGFLGPASTLLRDAGAVDLIYLDPPYNGRQYPGYYHIPELLARGWADDPEIRGKTGLIPDDGLRSDWCRKAQAGDALREVLASTDTRHVLFSYNDEGLLEGREIESALRERGDPDTYRRFRRGYRRYRSDADGPERTYTRDRVFEQLHYVRCR